MSNRVARQLVLALTVAGLGAAVLTCSGCGGDPGPEVWVIGLDGADWDQLDPLIAQGALPNLAALRDGGAAGILRSDMPMISPILWSSIATGKTPDMHGVTWFMTDGPDGEKVPISSYQRQVRTFWNIASEAGHECGIVGWWATWPAEPINGFLVTDYVAWHSFGVTGRSSTDQGKTWPPELIHVVDDIMPAPADIPDAEILPMVHLPAAQLSMDPAADSYADSHTHLRQAMATSRGYTDLVLHQLKESRPELMSVYYEGTDAITHLFGDYQEPRLPWVSDADFAAYRDVVDEYWKWQDALLGELLDQRGPQTTIIVISDHGFRRGDERRKEDEFHIETADADHMPDGVVIINGPGVRVGAKITNADLYDVAPTVLYTMGLAVGSDMPGRVLTDAFTSAAMLARPVRAVPTYETSPLVRAEDVEEDEAARENLEKMLRSLGYIAGTKEDSGGEVYSAEQVVNLATVLMRQGRADEAVTKLNAALAEHPGHQEIRLNLAQALARSGDWDASEKMYRELVAEAPERLEYHEDLAISLSQAGDTAGALAAIDAGLAVKPDWAEGLTARGSYLFALGRTSEAKTVLDEAIELDPRYSDAHFNLGRVLVEQNDLVRATAAFERSHELDPGNVQTTLGLAAVLEQQGDLPRVLDVLNRALEVGGESPGILGEIGAVMLNSGRPQDAVDPLQKARTLAPNNADIAGNLGMAFAMTGDLDAAVSAFEEVIALQPELSDGHAQLGSLYAEQNRPDLAIRELEIAVSQQPDNAGYRLNQGTILHRFGQADNARIAYREAIRLAPNLAPAYYNLGLLERSQGNTIEGQRLIKQAREMDPSLPER